jgi:chromosome partitioning protein
MQVITVSGYKGGTGKTTLATLLGIAATMDGLRVAGLDLDPNTRNFGSVLTRRRASRLAGPDHVAMANFQGKRPATDDPRWLDDLIRMASAEGYHLLVIDTGSGTSEDLYRAHLLAHVVLTPMNDSPGDLHGLFAARGTPQAAKMNYRELVERARFERSSSGMPAQRWYVCRNRISALSTRIGKFIEGRVQTLAEEMGFDGVWCVRDRVVHKAIALDGRTVFDAPQDAPLTMSELAGRSEARALLNMLIAPSQPMRLAA